MFENEKITSQKDHQPHSSDRKFFDEKRLSAIKIEFNGDIYKNKKDAIAAVEKAVGSFTTVKISKGLFPFGSSNICLSNDKDSIIKIINES